MRNRFPGKGVWVGGLVALLWVALARGRGFLLHVGWRVEQRTRDTEAEFSAVEGLLRSAAPQFVHYAADALIGAGALLGLLFLQLLVTTPFALLKLDRRGRKIEAELAALREELKRNRETAATTALRERATPAAEPWLASAPGEPRMKGAASKAQAD